MPDIEHQKALIAVRDLGLTDESMSAVDSHCRHILRQEFERKHSSVWPRFHRARRSMVVSLGVLLACGLGVSYAALNTSSTLSSGIECHLDGNLHGSGTITHLDGRSASESCAQLWAQGDVADGVRLPPGPLRACLSRDGGGAIHVFASADIDICSHVGLRAAPTAGADLDSRSYGRFANQLNDRLDSTAFACPTEAQTRGLVQDELAKSGLTGWTITDTDGYSHEHPCASLALDSDSRTVTIIPSAR